MSAFTETNRKAFDQLSATYNTQKWLIDLSNTVAAALQARKDWIGVPWVSSSDAPDEDDNKQPQTEVRLLDYACGTGAITKALGSLVTTIRGIDISPNMVAQFNAAARDSGLPEERVHAIVGDLCAASVQGDALLQQGEAAAEWRDFDLAVIGLGFHHFEFPQLALQRLAERLKSGSGVLVIVDFLPFELGAGHHGHHHHHHGHGGQQQGDHHSNDDHQDHQHHHHADEPVNKHQDNGDQKPPGAEASQTNDFPDMKPTIKHSGFSPEEMRDLYTAAGFEDFDIVVLKQPVVLELPTGTVEHTLFLARGRKSATVWQKLADWVGGMQDWAAGGVKIGRDARHWDPGFANGAPVWSAGKQKDEDYDALGQQQQQEEGAKKTWNGF